jgi:transposase InsO family protein
VRSVARALGASRRGAQIKDARLAAIPPRERPYYPPAERFAILQLRGRACWNAAETARRFLVTPATIGSWTQRLDEHGRDALVQTRVPVNRYDDAVTLLVHELHRAAPHQGRRKKAALLMRAGLRIAASTVRRLRQRRPPPAPPLRPQPPPKTELGKEPTADKPARAVTAKYPGHVWHVDLTVMPIGAGGSGFWVAWWPFALILRWALSWHIALVLDHFSRALVAFAVFKQEPTADEIRAFLERAVVAAGRAPKYIVSDQGAQFQGEYRDWCKQNGVRPRFGAVGQHGSIALIERFIRSLKEEFLRRILVPFSLARMHAVLSAYQLWYNEHRPHEALGGRTPAEVRDALVPARDKPRLEPRTRWPLARGDPSVRRCGRLELVVSHVGGYRELPVIELREAA